MCEACCWLGVAIRKNSPVFGQGVKPRTSLDEKGTDVSTDTDVITGVLHATARVAVKLAAMLNPSPPDGLHTCSRLMQLTFSPRLVCTLPLPQVPER